jgi:hypothetical protein
MSTTHNGAYVAPTAFRLPAGFNVARFQKAWQVTNRVRRMEWVLTSTCQAFWKRATLKPAGKRKAVAARQCSVSSDAIEDVYPATPLQEGVFLMSTTHNGA